MQKATQAQLFRFYFTFLISTPTAYMLQPLLAIGKYEGGIGIWFAYLINLFVLFFTLRLADTHPQQNWIQFGRNIIGQIPHTIVLFGYLLSCTITATINSIRYTDFFGYIYLHDTPSILIIAILFLATAIVARTDFYKIFYLSDGVFLLTITSLIFIFILCIRFFTLESALPLITHHYPQRIWESGYFVSSWMSDVTYIIFIYPFLKEQPKTFKYISLSYLTAILMIFFMWFFCLIFYGPYLGSRLTHPLVAIFRQILMGEFWENLDAILTAVWSGAFLIKTVFLLYITSQILSALLPLSAVYKPYLPFLVFSLWTGIAKIMSYFPAELSYINSVYLKPFLLLLNSCPFLYYLIYKARTRNGKALATTK